MKEYENFDSGKISWFHCGGKIDIFCIVENLEELQQALNKYNHYKDNILVVGAGSNILIKDAGFHGLVIKLTGDFTKIKMINNDKIYAGCGCFSKQVSQFALKNNLIGCEFLDSIPGTIGGEISMNAGCFGSEIKDILVNCEILLNHEVKMYTNKELNFSYRHSIIPSNGIILNTTLQLKKGNSKEIKISKQKLQQYATHRKEHQIVGATCGSTFANPVDQTGQTIAAWSFINKVGLRGVEINHVKFSEKHCNFLINTGKATATDIENLITLAQKKVKEQFNIDLKTEIKIY